MLEAAAALGSSRRFGPGEEIQGVVVHTRYDRIECSVRQGQNLPAEDKQSPWATVKLTWNGGEF